MLEQNIFNRTRLERELGEVESLFVRCIVAAQGRGTYPDPVPCLKSLEKRKGELIERIKMLRDPVGSGVEA